MLNYTPKVNDYVYWNDRVEGWIYFKDSEYITIEVSVKPKDEKNYYACKLHSNYRLLILCYPDQWHELKYIKSRKSVKDTKYD